MTVQDLIEALEKIEDKTQIAVDANNNPINEVWNMAATSNVAVWYNDEITW